MVGSDWASHPEAPTEPGQRWPGSQFPKVVIHIRIARFVPPVTSSYIRGCRPGPRRADARSTAFFPQNPHRGLHPTPVAPPWARRRELLEPVLCGCVMVAPHAFSFSQIGDPPVKFSLGGMRRHDGTSLPECRQSRASDRPVLNFPNLRPVSIAIAVIPSCYARGCRPRPRRAGASSTPFHPQPGEAGTKRSRVRQCGPSISIGLRIED